MSLSETDDENVPILIHYNEITTDNDDGHKNTWYFYGLVIFASLGGFLFGYDTGVISGAMIPLKRVFTLSIQLQQVIVSVAIGGAILGSWVSGVLNEKLGRRVALLIASALFTFGSIVLGAANGIVMLVIGRIIVGLGIGFASMTVPIYIAEASPPSVRGKLVTVYQLNITCGQFIASVMNGAFSYLARDGWRYMLSVSALPSLIMFIGCLFTPESPRWLIQRGRKEEARKVLQFIRGSTNVDQEIDNIELATSAHSTITMKDSLKKMITTQTTRRALLLGCGLQAIQQLAAINTVMYYSASIIQLAGVDDEKLIIWLAAAVAFGNCFFTLVAFFTIERFGRRKLSLISTFGVVLALCLLAFTFYLLDNKTPSVTFTAPKNYTKGCDSYQSCSSCVLNSKCGFCYIEDGLHISNGSCLAFENKRPSFCSRPYKHSNIGEVKWKTSICPSTFAWLAVCSMIFYLAMFAPGLGPMPWTVNAEIYPLWARNAGTSASTSTNWIMNMLVSLTFLSLMEYLTRPGAFLLYAGLSLLGLIFLYVLMPETKGKKLEEIEKLFDS